MTQITMLDDWILNDKNDEIHYYDCGGTIVSLFCYSSIINLI